MRSTTRAGGASSGTSIGSPASFFSTMSSSASRYSSLKRSGSQGSLRLSMSCLAISTSLGRTLPSDAVSKSAARISSGQYIVSRTKTSSLNRSAARCSLSRKLTLAIPTLFSSASALRRSAYALAPVSSGTR